MKEYKSQPMVINKLKKGGLSKLNEENGVNKFGGKKGQKRKKEKKERKKERI